MKWIFDYKIDGAHITYSLSMQIGKYINAKNNFCTKSWRNTWKTINYINPYQKQATKYRWSVTFAEEISFEIVTSTVTTIDIPLKLQASVMQFNVL